LVELDLQYLNPQNRSPRRKRRKRSAIKIRRRIRTKIIIRIRKRSERSCRT